MKTAQEVAESIADKWTRLDGEDREDVIEAMVEAIEADRAQRVAGENETLDPDPRFPQRPRHPDLARLSSAAAEQDAVSDMLGLDAALLIDVDSAVYMARRRAHAIGFAEVPPPIETRILSLYLDALHMGIGFANRGGHRPTKTGTAGEGSSS